VDLTMTELPSLELGDQLRKKGNLAGAIEAYLEAANRADRVPAALCLALARTYLALNKRPEAIRWATGVVDAGDDFPSWLAAATLVEKAAQGETIPTRRRARVALVGSFTTLQIKTILPLAALRQGIALEVWEAPYGQYRQQLLDPQSELYRQQPDFIVLAV